MFHLAAVVLYIYCRVLWESSQHIKGHSISQFMTNFEMLTCNHWIERVSVGKSGVILRGEAIFPMNAE